MAKVYLSPEAETDLERIGDYIARRKGSPRTALNTIRKIKARIDELKDFPQLGKPLSAVTAIDTAYRFLGCGNYLAFYRYKNDSIFIDRIFHSRQDYVAILLGDVEECD